MLRWLRKIFDFDRGRFDAAELARRLGISEQELLAFKPGYHRFMIPKRRRGMRQIMAPGANTKRLQRRILRRLLSRLRAHSAACGFERGRSIVDAARPHVGRSVVIRLDVRDFFSSTSAMRVERYFRDIGWRKEPAGLLARLCTHEGALPQGAPTSPRLANLVNLRMDARLAALARSLGASYTRYADDLIFSSDEPVHDEGGHNPRTLQKVPARRRLTEVVAMAKLVLADYGYQLHEGPKLRIMRRHDRQQITGLVVNQRIALPRATRRWLRAVEHRYASGRAATIAPDQLQGWRSLREMVTRQAGAGT